MVVLSLKYDLNLPKKIYTGLKETSNYLLETSNYLQHAKSKRVQLPVKRH